MPKKKTEDDVAPGAPLWMATFGDLMSLLLTFFVLLVSFSTMHEVDFNKAMGSLQGALGTLNAISSEFSLIHRDTQRPMSYMQRFIRSGEISESKEQDMQLLEPESSEINSLAEVTQQVVNYSQKMGISESVSVNMDGQGVRIQLPSELLFEGGTNQLKTNQKTTDLLNKLTTLLRNVPYGLSVEGHTDDRTISNPEYHSNWELSSARALTVLQYFENNGIKPERMEAVAAAQYRPVANNGTLKGRKLNRRVEIFIDASWLI